MIATFRAYLERPPNQSRVGYAAASPPHRQFWCVRASEKFTRAPIIGNIKHRGVAAAKRCSDSPALRSTSLTLWCRPVAVARSSICRRKKKDVAQSDRMTQTPGRPGGTALMRCSALLCTALHRAGPGSPDLTLPTPCCSY